MGIHGSVVWPSASEPLWRFHWLLADSPDEEGLVITSAYYRGHKVFAKASLPSLRVQYDGPCGPFKDPLNYNNAQTTTGCPTTRVCIRSYVSSGIRGLEVQSYHRISAYRLTHRWVFWEDGIIYPRLFSAGLYCNYNHRHHAYWRFDFDIDDQSNDLVLEYNAGGDNVGWGAGWFPIRTEDSRVKLPAANRQWAVLDKSSGRGYQIVPGRNDGFADAFSTRDLWVLRYLGTEDRNGRQGTAYSDNLQQYLNGENVDGGDVVVWYTGHLSHFAHGGGDEWHYAGPTLYPIRWT